MTNRAVIASCRPVPNILKYRDHRWDLQQSEKQVSFRHTEPISVLINIFMLLGQCLLSTLLVPTLTMCELCHWPSIAGMSPQSHCGDEEDGRIESGH